MVPLILIKEHTTHYPEKRPPDSAIMSAADKAALDLGIFSPLMSYPNDGDVDANAIAKKFKTTYQKVAGMINSAKNTDRAYQELIAADALPRQIPVWFKRPEGVIIPQQVSSHDVNNTKRDVINTQNKETPPLGEGGTGAPGDMISQLSTTPDINDITPDINTGNALGAVYDNVRLESQRLADLGIIRDQGGRYLKATINPDGSPGYVEVDPAEALASVRQDVGSQLSEAAIGDLNLHMRTVMRKIGLNPTVFMNYAEHPL